MHGISFSTILWFYPSWNSLICTAVCQKQIVVPNNSLLYCSERCKHEDALSSSPPWSSSFTTLSETGSMKASSFEPSRKDQWGITPSPTPGSAIPSSPTHEMSQSIHPAVRRSSTCRPLPPLHPRTSGTSPRSLELVLPVYRETSMPKATKSKSLDYGRRIVNGNSARTGGLKELFHFKEVPTNPTH